MRCRRNSRGVLAVALALTLFWVQASGAQQSPASDHAMIDVAGDVLPESSWKGAQDAAHMFDGVRDEFAQAELVFVNLEEPITTADTITPNKNPAEVRAGRDYILRACNAALPEIFKEAGIGIIGLANNHMMDYKRSGLRDTLRAFEAAEFPVVGVGLKPDAKRALVFETHGINVAFLAFTDVVPPNYEATETREGVASSKDETDLVDAVKEARERADRVILMMHWGGQGGHLITPRQRHLARLAAQAGCDAVVGMHPHVLQGIEYVGRVPVFYSIGNFAFPSARPDARESIVVRLILGANGLESAEVVPAEISPRGAPRIAPSPAREEVLSHLDGFCRMFNSRLEDGKLVPAQVRAELVYESSPGSSWHRGSPRRSRRRGSTESGVPGKRAGIW